MARAKTQGEIEEILAHVSYADRTFELLPKGDGFLLRLFYMEKDVETGKMELQKSRKHYVSPYMTESEIVETAFLCAQRSSEHVLREHFTYQGARIYSPHFHVRERLEICRHQLFDARLPADTNAKETR